MKTPLPLPPLELLNHLFYICEASPSGLRWKNSRTNTVKSGDIAGRRMKNGYWSVSIKTDKSRRYLTHRIIYYMTTGDNPHSAFIDHVNGLADPLSLRIATPAQNQYNRKKYANECTSKYKGVCFKKNYNKWEAYISKDRKYVFLGRFDIEEEAALAYNQAAVALYGEFACLNDIQPNSSQS